MLNDSLLIPFLIVLCPLVRLLDVLHAVSGLAQVGSNSWHACQTPHSDDLFMTRKSTGSFFRAFWVARVEKEQQQNKLGCYRAGNNSVTSR